MKVIFYSCLFCLAISCSREKLESFDETGNTDDLHIAGIVTKKANAFNTLFTRYGNGWTGGDATYSVLLPDGRTVWMFGDTFLDTVYADRSRPPSGLIRNSFVVQDGAALTTLYSGTEEAPRAFVDIADDNFWYWPDDATVLHDTLFVYFAMYQNTGEGGGFGFKYKRTDRVAFSLPDIHEISRTTIWNSTKSMYGTAVFEDEDYIYIYATEWSSPLKYAHVARVPSDNLHAAMEFWNGTSWVITAPPFNSGRLLKNDGGFLDVSAQYAVFYFDGAYRLVTQEGFLGPNIYTYQSVSPVGPWSGKKKIYKTPEAGGDIITYNAWVHPQFVNDEGYILLSYNINSLNFADLFSNADNYRPKFVWFKY